MILESAADQRAETLLRLVLGEAHYRSLHACGYLDLPSRLHRGRVYRLDVCGNLAYRDPGEIGFGTNLCIQPTEPVPRGDLVAARYLLVTADEERLLLTANPLRFGLTSFYQALRNDLRLRLPPLAASAAAVGTLLFLIAAFFLACWTAARMAGGEFGWIAVVFALSLAPATLGAILFFAGVADVVRSLRIWRALLRVPSG